MAITFEQACALVRDEIGPRFEFEGGSSGWVVQDFGWDLGDQWCPAVEWVSDCEFDDLPIGEGPMTVDKQTGQVEPICSALIPEVLGNADRYGKWPEDWQEE